MKYGGITQNLAETMRNGTRYDSFAQESVPVKVYSLSDNNFSPSGIFVIQSFYRDSRTNTPQREIKIGKQYNGVIFFFMGLKVANL